jgi:hypothetical protein
VLPGNARPSLASFPRRTDEGTDNREEVPASSPAVDQSTVPFCRGRRSVGGQRREEIAMLAGMSTDYPTLLERGYRPRL